MKVSNAFLRTLALPKREPCLDPQRSLPSTSSNKRKRQDAFSDSSAFPSSTTPQKQGDDAVETRRQQGKDVTSISNGPPSRSSTSLLNRVLPQSKAQSAKPQGIMAFSPMSRLDRSFGRNDGSPQTPSKIPRLASPGLPVPTGFALPPAPGHSLSIHAQPGSVKRINAADSKGTVGFSPLQSALSPLSSLGGIPGGSTTGAQSPSANLAKTRAVQSIAQADPSSNSMSNVALRRLPQDRQFNLGLPSMPNFGDFAISNDPHSPSVDPVEGFTDVLSVQDVSHSKGRQNE